MRGEDEGLKHLELIQANRLPEFNRKAFQPLLRLPVAGGPRWHRASPLLASEPVIGGLDDFEQHLRVILRQVLISAQVELDRLDRRGVRAMDVITRRDPLRWERDFRPSGKPEEVLPIGEVLPALNACERRRGHSKFTRRGPETQPGRAASCPDACRKLSGVDRRWSLGHCLPSSRTDAALLRRRFNPAASNATIAARGTTEAPEERSTGASLSAAAVGASPGRGGFKRDASPTRPG